MIATTQGRLLALAMIATFAGVQVARAEGDECISLYVKRNRIYADVHYCFKSETALTYFSNQGCIPGEPRFTSSQQRQIAEIKKQERQYHCRTL
jgi:YARHG domain